MQSGKDGNTMEDYIVDRSRRTAMKALCGNGTKTVDDNEKLFKCPRESGTCQLLCSCGSTRSWK
jgi:hypothetical protein